MDKSLELALRIRADLEEGRRELQGLSGDIEAVGESSAAASKQLGQVGESADQQTARIKAMVTASLQQQSAIDAAAAATARAAATTVQANTAWRDTAAAQSEAMNGYHNAERALREKAAAEQKAAEDAARTTAEAGKQDASLRKLLGTIDRTEKELAQLDQQERELAAHFKAGRLDAEAYASSLEKIRSRRDALKGISTDAKASNVAMTGLAASIRRVQGLLMTGIAGYGLTSASRAIVNTNIQWQQAIHTMEAATGSAAAARQELEFVRDVSERLGLELLSTSQSYARLVAAAKESPELGRQIQGVFEGVSAAATTLHLAPDQVNGLLLALEQMVSKGKVQTQELVLQLGQRVPGAFALAAKALDTNTAQLSQWLEKGMIPATEFLPRFGDALREAYGDQAQKAANGLQGELNRLTNAFTDLKIQAGESGFIDTYTNAIRDLRDVMKDPAVIDGLNTLITALGKLIEFAAKGLGGAVSVVKFVSEEVAARISGPAGDDAVRLDEAIERETKWMEKAQQRLFDAYERNDQAAAARIEASMSETQANLQRWREQLDAIYNGKGAIQLPATPVTAPAANRPAFTPSGGEDKAAARLAKQNSDWVAQLEKEAATYGKGKAALREYELGQRNLTGALEARARAAWATLDAAEKQKKADSQAAKDAKLLAQLNLDYLRATGQNVEAAGAEIEKKYGALQQRLQAVGNAEGADLVSKLMNVEKAKAELEDLEQQLDRIFAEQSRRNDEISTQQQAGLISELGARQQILDMNRSTADQVEQLLPKMRELAAVTGDPQALERLRDLEAQLRGLRVVADEFTNALKSGFETGIQNALRGLAMGTMDLQEAATSFLQSIAGAMADLAAKQIAQQATDGLGGMFDGLIKSAPQAISAVQQTAAAQQAAITTVQATQVAADTAMATSATTAASTAATAQTAAAAQTASAWTPAAIAASIGSFGAAAAIGLAAVVAALAFKAFSGGGHVRGPGTTTSDSIPALLSDQEFVTRAAVVQQPGALGFLEDFNARGMVALDDWSTRVRHATGGLAGVPAPALPAPASIPGGRLAEPAAGGDTTIHNGVDVFLGMSDDFIAERTWNKPGRDRFYAELEQNAATVRQILGV
ncbi:tape measure protein [Zestomonas carbonaria]|uniref:Tape measure protein N-terminal domain-containing protein n=1 Tax=Zestomonas carbonaria TaxID=2762745 RepID=A0A7U7END7_9GAMM|nr:tape measure protein [Pseudomonas carbonaria]CAD5107240.1 hypothetical protein PSEWESI4_01511 [Pseudomonas carbonaria]